MSGVAQRRRLHHTRESVRQSPQLERRDYVVNANDSAWMPHATARLHGFSVVHGPEGTSRSLRTRMNALLLADTSPGGPAGPDGKFSLEERRRSTTVVWPPSYCERPWRSVALSVRAWLLVMMSRST